MPKEKYDNAALWMDYPLQSLLKTEYNRKIHLVANWIKIKKKVNVHLTLDRITSKINAQIIPLFVIIPPTF